MTNNNTAQKAGNDAIQISQVVKSKITITTSPADPKIEDYAQMLGEAEKCLHQAQYQKCIEMLQGLPANLSLPGRVHIIRAIAILEGRSFNGLSLNQREAVEQDLLLAHQKLGSQDLLSLIFLTILEIDYYHYHGQTSKNGVDVVSVIERVSTTNLNKDDVALIKLLVVSQKTKNKFSTIFL